MRGLMMTGESSGWGEASGFAVKPMGGIGTYYAAVAELRNVQIAITFRMDVDGGKEVSVVAPKNFVLLCKGHNRISVPGGGCEDSAHWRATSTQATLPVLEDQVTGMRISVRMERMIRLTFNNPLSIGEYAFSVSAHMPRE